MKMMLAHNGILMGGGGGGETSGAWPEGVKGGAQFGGIFCIKTGTGLLASSEILVSSTVVLKI